VKRIVLILGVIGALAASLLAGMPSAVAASTETDYAVDGLPAEPPDTSTNVCTATTWAATCFQKYGDLIWVRDNQPDDRYAYSYWENYLRDPSGNRTLYRWCRCIDNLGYVTGWTRCDKSFYEDQSCPSHYVWVRNNS
jgi:hypothetical protein